MSSPEKETPEKDTPTLAPDQHALLLRVARASINHGLEHQRPLAVDPADFPAPLQQPRASFVTLTLDGMLRGCIGSLEAQRPLVADVACNAYAAAFQDPRFPPLTGPERDNIRIQISVLGKPVPMTFYSESDLVRQLRPRKDGLIIEDGVRRGTFLPSVWESLPEPREFLCQLKLKAGLSENYWSDTLRVYRYTTESFSEN